MVHVKRHIVKAITYRILGTLQTITIGYIFTGSIVISSSIGIVELCVKPVIYFCMKEHGISLLNLGLTNTRIKVIFYKLLSQT